MSPLPISLFDLEEDAADLRYGLYFYPDERLNSARDIGAFATLIVDQNDAVHELGSKTFVETAEQQSSTYIWSTVSTQVSNTLGYAPIDKLFPRNYIRLHGGRGWCQ